MEDKWKNIVLNLFQNKGAQSKVYYVKNDTTIPNYFVLFKFDRENDCANVSNIH